jgi:hypothetical protein
MGIGMVLLYPAHTLPIAILSSYHYHRPEIGRIQKLFPAPCRRGESPPEDFFITMLASEVMCE